MTIPKSISTLVRAQAGIGNIMFVLIFIAVMFAVQAVCCGQLEQDSASVKVASPRTEHVIDRGIHFLLDQLDDDGIWHSPNYGNLKEGAAITSFVLYSLGHCESRLPAESKVALQAATNKLIPGIRDGGFVTNPNGPDYSNYASAMLLVAASKLDLELPTGIPNKLVSYLIRSQLDEEEGYASGQPDFGGWDLSGWMTGQRQTTGTNISVTSCVLEALFDYKNVEGVAPAIAKARSWIKGCHNSDGDGGFFFHPKREHDGNKAGWHDGDRRQQVRSYGTATADGMRCLDYLNIDDQNAIAEAAQKWFEKNPSLKQVPGFEHETHPGTWADGLRYYFYYTMSKSLHLLPKDRADHVAAQIIEILKSEQRTNGSWHNSNARMREDDPLIATGFAIIALCNAKKWLED